MEALEQCSTQESQICTWILFNKQGSNSQIKNTSKQHSVKFKLQTTQFQKILSLGGCSTDQNPRSRRNSSNESEKKIKLELN